MLRVLVLDPAGERSRSLERASGVAGDRQRSGTGLAKWRHTVAVGAGGSTSNAIILGLTLTTPRT